jgi:hypothetical protein
MLPDHRTHLCEHFFVPRVPAGCIPIQSKRDRSEDSDIVLQCQQIVA